MRTNLKFRAGAIVRSVYTYLYTYILLLGRLLLAGRSLLPLGYSLLLPSGYSLFLASEYSRLLPSGYSLLSTRLLLSGLLLSTS